MNQSLSSNPGFSTNPGFSVFPHEPMTRLTTPPGSGCTNYAFHSAADPIGCYSLTFMFLNSATVSIETIKTSKHRNLYVCKINEANLRKNKMYRNYKQKQNKNIKLWQAQRKMSL